MRFTQREMKVLDRTKDLLKWKDELIRVKRDLEKASERAKSVPSGSSSERESQLQAEVTKCMVCFPLCLI